MEKIAYDTNQLINLLKTNKKTAQGLTTIFNIIEFPKALELKELSIIYPTIDDYDESLKISAALLKEGKPIPAIDIMIAAMCLQRQLTLCTANKHFENIKTIKNNFKLKITQ